MGFLTAIFLIVGASAGAAPERAAVDFLPRIAGRGDVALWRDAMGGRLAYAHRRAIYVHAADTDTVARLHELGIDAEDTGWQMVRVDAAQLRALLSESKALKVRSAPVHWPLLETSLDEIAVQPVFDGVGMEAPRNGEGVLIGIVDTGIDLGHPMFRDVNGRSRVVAVWDQDGAGGPHPDEFAYGKECDAERIAGDACDIVDSRGHGTHVAGIAAAIAPQAEIAVVRSNNFTRMADAIDYLFELAKSRGQPIVVNVSVGAHYGPHDGQTPFEHYLEKITGPGKLVVAATGNDGDRRIHVEATLGEEAQRVALENLPIGNVVDTKIELWSMPTAAVELVLELWVGEQVTAELPLRAMDSDILVGSFEAAGVSGVGITYGVDLPEEHALAKRTVIIESQNGATMPTGGRFALRMSGAGRIDGWLGQNTLRYGRARFGDSAGPGWLRGDSAKTITVPATAAAVISVGSYTTRDWWLSEDNTEHTIDSLIYGAISPFSSRGPTMAPAVTGHKPDVSAPGSMIVSARAWTIPSGPNTIDGERLIMQGTSMAAPHVTGILALALEADRRLKPHEARSLLARTSRADNDTGTLPNSLWGHGKIDAAALVRVAETEARGCSAAASPSLLWLLPALAAVYRRRRRGAVRVQRA